MPASLLTDAAWLAPFLALAVAAVSSITRSLVSLGKKIVEERSRTARFTMALKDSTPQQRSKIIIAYGSLEGGRASEPTTGESEEALPSSPERFSLVARSLRGGRETEPGKE
ncbi:MAG: hypothetical protein JO115_25450 [Pseudonocardiales bacterium]|nr:hypothetical protein [Pseudonocardiales bacterium]